MLYVCVNLLFRAKCKDRRRPSTASTHTFSIPIHLKIKRSSLPSYYFLHNSTFKDATTLNATRASESHFKVSFKS